MPPKHYLFTLNNYTPEELHTLQTTVYRNCTYLCFSQEVAASGTPHLQGYLQLSKPVKYSTIQNTWPGFARVAFPQNGVTFGTDEENYTYCKGPYDKVVGGVRKTKPENPTFWETGTREARGGAARGKRTDLQGVRDAIERGETYDTICETHFAEAAKYSKFIKERIQARRTAGVLNSLRAEFENALLRPWQLSVVDMVTRDPNPRQIHWIWEPVGNTGKSWMAKYLAVMHDACLMDVGKKADMAYLYSQNQKPIVVFDLSRTTAPGEGREHTLDGAYSLAENLKNGSVTSLKYESTGILMTSCHVIFFANFAPDMTKLSADRYVVTHI